MSAATAHTPKKRRLWPKKSLEAARIDAIENEEHSPPPKKPPTPIDEANPSRVTISTNRPQRSNRKTLTHDWRDEDTYIADVSRSSD